VISARKAISNPDDFSYMNIPRSLKLGIVMAYLAAAKKRVRFTKFRIRILSYVGISITFHKMRTVTDIDAISQVFWLALSQAPL
jgi:hypothetical protein